MSLTSYPTGGEAYALRAPPGTRMPFNQLTSPPGWVNDANAALSDCSMRVNGASGGQVGGSTAWSAWNFGGTFSNNNFALSTAQLPAHNHGVNDPTHVHGNSIGDPGHVHGVNDPSHAHNVPGNFGVQGTTYSQEGTNSRLFNLVGVNTAGAFTGISIANSGSNLTMNNAAAATGISTQNAGSGAAIATTYATPQVKFTDFCIGIKS